MKRAGRLRRLLWLLIILFALLAGVGLLSQSNCPRQGFALSHQMRAFVLLKNRTSLPREDDFDDRANLDALLEAGDDRGRWTAARAAVVEGFVVDVQAGGIEAANCYSLTNRDTHVYIAARADAAPRERLVAEVTPRMRAWAREQGMDWSEETLRRELTGRRVRVEGWLLFDMEHENESENIAPNAAHNWRATAWEIHPITRIEVVK